jgi:hypothetical protein
LRSSRRDRLLGGVASTAAEKGDGQEKGSTYDAANADSN